MYDQQRATTHTVTLRDGLTATIRPLDFNDGAALLDFGLRLPPDDNMYLEDDFQANDTITRLVNASAAENWRQIVAEVDGKLVGYSAVRRLAGWSSHVADILLVVDIDFRRSGIGRLLAEAIFDAARELGATKVIVEMLEEQKGGQAIFEQLGFHVEGNLSRHACDRQGECHNLLMLAYHVS